MANRMSRANTKKKILFVCSGNVFRSVSAEYCLKYYLKKNNIKDWSVSSAGIIAEKAQIDPKVICTLNILGIKSINHRQKRLDLNDLKNNDIVVAMAENHANFIRERFNFSSIFLFNELAVNKKTSILDVEDEVADYRTNRRAVEEKLERTVIEINEKIPNLFKAIAERF
jgi:protein-tyrosine-phosphatase